MTDPEIESAEPEQPKERRTSTTYSNILNCGACGAPVTNVPVTYEHLNIDWRCAKCLRRDKPALEEHV